MFFVLFLLEQKSSFCKRRIPTCREVIGRLLYFTTTLKLNVNAAASDVANEVVLLWKERRSTSHLRLHQSIVRSIKLLHGRYFKLKRNASRSSKRQIDKQIEFNSEANNEFDISTLDALQIDDIPFDQCNLSDNESDDSVYSEETVALINHKLILKSRMSLFQV